VRTPPHRFERFERFERRVTGDASPVKAAAQLLNLAPVGVGRGDERDVAGLETVDASLQRCRLGGDGRNRGRLGAGLHHAPLDARRGRSRAGPYPTWVRRARAVVAGGARR
jgi:hypothetical protein